MDLQGHLIESATFSVETDKRLREAFERHEQQEEGDFLTAAMDAMCTEAHFRKMSPAAIVIAMHHTWAQISCPVGVTQRHWSRAYYAALGMCISTYFGEKGVGH